MEETPISLKPKQRLSRKLLVAGVLIVAVGIVWILNSGGNTTPTPTPTPTPTAKVTKTPSPTRSATPTATPEVIDLNGLWKSSASAGVIKITQTGNSVVFTWQQVDPNSRWQEKVGDVIVQATLSGRKLTGQVKIITEKGYCAGTSWWHSYSATVSKDSQTMQESFQSIMYYHETCQETGGSYPQKSNTLTKIQ